MTKQLIFDPARCPLDIEPADWVIICRRHHRRRRLLRLGLAVLLMLPLGWVGWRLAHPPPDAVADFQTAQQLFERGNARAALIAVKTSLRIDPEAGAARRLAGQIYLHLAAYPEAGKELRKARELGIADPLLDIELATVMLRQDQIDEVLALLEASALKQRAPAEWEALRADADLARAQTDPAARRYERALALQPSNARALRGLARLAQMRGADTEAQTHIELALREDARDYDSWLLKGDLDLAANDPALAEDAYRRAIELNPFRRSAMIALTRVLLLLNETELAARQFDALADIAPDNAWTDYLRAAIALQRDQVGPAAEACQRALLKDPAHAQSQLLLGEILTRQGKLEQAGDVLARYRHQHPLDVHAARLFARVALLLGTPVQAMDALTDVARAALADPEMTALLGMAFLDSGASAPPAALLDLLEPPAR
jgi:putative PEP-CTERM system TPR-repeat lipoprotein